MNLKLNCGDFESNLLYTAPLNGGIHYVFKFENHYGASVIKHDFSYGHDDDLWELAVIKFDDGNKWDLCYDTSVTSDVIGWLTDDSVLNLLQEIKEL